MASNKKRVLQTRQRLKVRSHQHDEHHEQVYVPQFDQEHLNRVDDANETRQKTHVDPYLLIS